VKRALAGPTVTVRAPHVIATPLKQLPEAA